MIKYLFKYLLIVLLAVGFTACSEDEGAQILGGLYEKVDITPEPGMNLVGRVTDGKNPIEGVVVSDGFTVTATEAQGVYQMRVKTSTTAFRWATWCGTTCLSTAFTRSRSGRSAYLSSR